MSLHYSSNSYWSLKGWQAIKVTTCVFSPVWGPRTWASNDYGESMVLRMKAPLGKDWAVCQERSCLLLCQRFSLLHSPKQIVGCRWYQPYARYPQSPNSLNNVIFPFPGGKGVEMLHFRCPLGILSIALSGCLRSVNICLGGEDSIFTSQGKEGVTYEMRIDHLILWSEFLPDILKWLPFMPAVCCP